VACPTLPLLSPFPPFSSLFSVLLFSLTPQVQTATDKMAAKEAFQKVTQKVERIKSKQEALLAGTRSFYLYFQFKKFEFFSFLFFWFCFSYLVL
jgi:hypothetical protein